MLSESLDSLLSVALVSSTSVVVGVCTKDALLEVDPSCGEEGIDTCGVTVTRGAEVGARFVDAAPTAVACGFMGPKETTDSVG